jgi:5'-methylthioadenosine phosphorylase
MTALPEAKLAREAEICLALVAMVTDYDCWHEAEESVSVGMILKVMNENTKAIQEVIPSIAGALGSRGECSCHTAAAGVVVTDPSLVPYETRRKLWMLYGRRYWKGSSLQL